ncbi:uncharacterized protein LOC131623554 [Vicia villosa]|uniref:uncharacterized protein LOC131623554 n=1 Tax=Vicia villosa TaxID=3911 RepID=UPI00273BD199|nr:uncharacterized protein LOC131623554 [Vicia villosa]
MRVVELLEKIQRVSLRANIKDSWRWHKNVYTSKDAYSLIMEGLFTLVGEDKELAAVWSNLIPLKVSVLAWRVWQNRIPTRDNLVKRGILVDSQNSCPFGCGEEESVSHIFFECISSGGKVLKDRFSVIWFACLWTIWKRRNEKIFGTPERCRSPNIFDIQETSWKWLK